MSVFLAQKCIDEMLKEVLKPPLKMHGYRKKARTWRKLDAPLIKVVNVQLSSSNSQHEASFTVNLGIFHEVFHRHRGLAISTEIKEYDCDVRMRIGALMDCRADHWWTVAWNKDNEKVKAGLLYNFENHAIPWLDSFHDLPDMLCFFLEHSRFFDASIVEHLLKGTNVMKYLATAHAGANFGFQGMIERWAARNGYAL